MGQKRGKRGRRIYVGWDVGAWNCDSKNRSQDALCVLVVDTQGLSLEGAPRRCNLREKLVDPEISGWSLIRAMLELCNVLVSGKVQSVTIAVDTPLGWPRATVDLLHQGDLVQVEREANQNPYCFRQTERRPFVLPNNKKTPLSAVRDRIGNQSTKGMYFLRKAGVHRDSVGIWKSAENNRPPVTVIETYPGPCRESGCLLQEFDLVSQNS